MIINMKKLSLIVLAFIMLVGRPGKVEAVTLKDVGDVAIRYGVTLTAVTAATALIYHYRLHLFFGLSGLEKRLNLQGFADSASIKNPKRRSFKWYQWRLVEQGGWLCAQDAKKDEKDVIAALHNDLQQFIMAHDEDIAFNNLIELKKDRVIYRPVSTKNNGQREFRLEVYSVVKRAMAKELQELRNYLWLCEWNIHSIKILSEIECALNAQRHAYRARFITRIEDIAKLSRVEFASLREIVSMSLEEAHGSGREQKALYLFFEVLARYARLYQIDECVGEYIAHRTNGQKWPAYDRHTDCDRKEKQTNFNKIEKQFSRIAARKNAWPALEDIERLKELLEDRKQLDSDREVILLGMTQDLDKVVESIIDQSVSVSQVHTSLDRLQRVFRATT